MNVKLVPAAANVFTSKVKYVVVSNFLFPHGGGGKEVRAS
jgi:hypothetical protein